MTTATKTAVGSTARQQATPVAGVPVLAGGMRQRRSVPRLIGGVVAALVGALVFGVVGMRADPAVDVLALARPVPAGAVITDADLRIVSIVADASMRVVRAVDKPTVVGQVAAVPLVEGTLLTAGQLGTVADPPAGQSLIAVAVKAGRAPADLAPGASVRVLVVDVSAGAAEASLPQAVAIVRAVQPPDASGVSVVTLQVDADAAVPIVSAAGEAAIVVQSPGR